MLPVFDGAVSLRIFPCGIEREKENRDWYDRQVDDETGHRDRNGAGPSEQKAEDCRERHRRRGSRQRGQCTRAHSLAKSKAGQQENHAVQTNDGAAQRDEQRQILTQFGAGVLTVPTKSSNGTV